jgi:hypothetical protein
MTDPIPLRQILDRWRADPELAAAIDAERDAILAEQERERLRAVLTLFGNLVDDQVTREQALAAGAAILAADPSLAETFPLDPDVIREEIVAEAWDRVFAVADPLTGIVPPDLWNDPTLAAAADEDAELAAIRAGAPIDLNPLEVDDETMLAGVDAWIAQYTTQQIDAITSFELDDPGRPAETRELALVRGPGEPPLDGGLIAGDIRLSYAEDPAGQYRLKMSREFLGNDTYQLELRLLWPGTTIPMVQTREEWALQAFVDGHPREVIDDDIHADAYRLRQPISGQEFGRLAFDVTLNTGGPA